VNLDSLDSLLLPQFSEAKSGGPLPLSSKVHNSVRHVRLLTCLYMWSNIDRVGHVQLSAVVQNRGRICHDVLPGMQLHRGVSACEAMMTVKPRVARRK
jgi:hypothetical protein